MRTVLITVIVCLSFWIMMPCYADEIVQEVDDIENNTADSSSLFKKDLRLVPVPIPISNPTIGSGLALALMYLHQREEGDTSAPNSISGIVGMYTSTQSWMTSLFHEGFYSNDKYRLRLALGYGEFHLKFYGIGNDTIIRDNPVDYKASTYFIMPRFLVRTPFPNWFLGAQHTYLEIENSFDFSNLLPGLPEIKVPTKTAGLGLVVAYDSRDSNLWPGKGILFETTATNYAEYFGGDYDYEKLKLQFVQYVPLIESVTFAYRIDGQFIDGGPPFYDLSNLNLRGFDRGRYVDNHAIIVQTQVRWNFYERWALLLSGVPDA
jgi:hypothetical protein